MTASLAIQYGVIGLAVAASAWYTVRKYWPRAGAKAGACGSSDGGCSTCGACATSEPGAHEPRTDAMPLAPPRPIRR